MTQTKDSISNGSASTCFEVCMAPVENLTPDLGRRIQAWIDEVWIPSNLEFNLRDYGEDKTFKYEDDFLRSPEIMLSDESKLLIRLYIKHPSRNWGDWSVLRLLPHLRLAFPEVKDA